MITIVIFTFCSLFTNLDHPKFSVRQTATKDIIAQGIDILPKIDQQLTQQQSVETRCRLERIREIILLEEEHKQWKNLKFNKNSTLLGWSTFSSIVGDNFSSRQLYYYLWSVHQTRIKKVFNSVDPKIAALDLYRENQYESDWESKILWYWFEIIFEIDCSVPYYEYGSSIPPEQFSEIFKKLKDK